MNHRLIALHHHDNVIGDFILSLEDSQGLCTTIRCPFVMTACHDGASTDALYVIEDVAVARSDRGHGQQSVARHALVHMSDHRLTEQRGEWLAGKAAAAHARRN